MTVRSPGGGYLSLFSVCYSGGLVLPLAVRKGLFWGEGGGGGGGGCSATDVRGGRALIGLTGGVGQGGGGYSLLCLWCCSLTGFFLWGDILALPGGGTGGGVLLGDCPLVV
ncbi:hypothetical protein MTP99_006866 [Tenebrio molitor]|nr:hypothetical protein MTP99_006866 [Tenebrio molitor]